MRDVAAVSDPDWTSSFCAKQSHSHQCVTNHRCLWYVCGGGVGERPEIVQHPFHTKTSTLMDAERLWRGYWLESVQCLSFTAPTLLIGRIAADEESVQLIFNSFVAVQVAEEN